MPEQSSPMTIEALADKLEAVSSLGGYIMESKEAAQIVTALRLLESAPATPEAPGDAPSCSDPNCRDPNCNYDNEPIPEAPGDVAEIVPDRGTIASLIRERFDPCPDLGQASYKAFEDSWNDGAEEIADAILALMPAPSSAVTEHARFLLDRLDEFDPGEYDAEREYHGHVTPAIARLRGAVG
jgi:hypothetical protein